MAVISKGLSQITKYIVFLAVVIGGGVFVYNNMPPENQGAERSSLYHKDQATDSLVRLLGLTGIRVQGDTLAPEPNWPEAKLTLSSRSLEEITQAIQGKKNPKISWFIKGERWETKGLEYLTLTSDQIRAILDLIFKKLEFGPAVLPKQHKYEGVLFLGSTLKSVRDRLNFINTYLARHHLSYNKFYILTGPRPLDPAVGETPESLLDPKGIIEIRPDWQKPAGQLPTNENAMVRWVFDQSRSDALPKEQIEIIYAGIDEERKRATTQTTIEAWLRTNPKDGLYLAVSSQPFNLYQKLVIEHTLLENKRPGIRIEVIGNAADERHYDLNKTNSGDLNKYTAVALDNIARICYELVAIQRLSKG